MPIKNKIRLLSILIIGFSLFSFINIQNKKSTKNGLITFEASVPSFEEVKAKSNNSSCVLNTDTGDLAALVLIKSFKFKVALMEEHFNENYMESNKFPKATFSGKIQNFDNNQLTNEFKTYNLKGKLEIKGKKKDIETKVKIKKVNESINLETNFSVNTNDFNIDIPSIVSSKVSKKVDISCNFNLK